MRLDMITRGLGLIFSGVAASPRKVTSLPQQAAMAEPQLVQRMMQVTALLVGALLVWAYFARLDDIARAGGILVAHGNNAVVQHSEGGILQSIYVQEGTHVTKGQPLLKLNDTDVEADTAAVKQRLDYLSAQVQRLGYVLGIRGVPDFEVSSNDGAAGGTSATLALLPPPSLDEESMANIFADIAPAAGPMASVMPDNDAQTLALQERYRTLHQGVQLAQSEYRRQISLRGQGFSTQSRVYAAERDMQTQSQAFAAFQADLAAQYAAALSEYRQQDEQLKKLDQRAHNTMVRAPTAGIVQGLRLNTLGTTVPSGVTLLEIVPEGAPLEALLRLSPNYIGMVKVGQRATLRLTTFEASHFGTLQGQVSKISADALADGDGRPTYQVWVKIPQSLEGARGDYALKPGMVLVAAITTGQHTILDYILKPIRNALDDLSPHSS